MTQSGHERLKNFAAQIEWLLPTEFPSAGPDMLSIMLAASTLDPAALL
jgi:hypothetical protein